MKWSFTVYLPITPIVGPPLTSQVASGESGIGIEAGAFGTLFNTEDYADAVFAPGNFMPYKAKVTRNGSASNGLCRFTFKARSLI